MQELRDELGCSQQNVSKHLQVLQQSGLVTRRKEGTYSRYSLADESVPDLCDLVCSSVQRQLSELNELVGGAR